MNEDIRNYNSNGQHHGYLELRDYNNVLIIRVNYKNDNEVGYEEWHMCKETSFYIR